MIGSINYCAKSTCPNISYAPNKCAQFTSQPTVVHWGAAKHIVHYLLHTKEYSITYILDGKGMEGYAHNLTSFTDADYASDINNRESSTG